ncbi:Glucan endo-1,3-beta-glucosidase, partial [Linum grandiflorum]
LQILLAPSTVAAYSIGINYGTQANNLPPPSQVATFLKSHTTIDRVKIFDANPDILRAFADTGISVTVTIANANVPSQAPRRPSRSSLLRLHSSRRLSARRVGTPATAFLLKLRRG